MDHALTQDIVPISEDMDQKELKILKKLSSHGFFTFLWTDQDKIFGVKMCVTKNQEKNFKYIEKNWQLIQEPKIQDMLIILVRKNSIESKIFKFLIKVWKIDKNYTNKFGNNCLQISCCKNHNVDMIKYLIEEEKFDCLYKSKENYNCLMSACALNNNVEVIKYLINELKMDPEIKDTDDFNCLHIACIRNNINVIKYLTTIINLNCLDKLGNNCLMMTMSNKNVSPEIIKHLIDDVKIDIGAKNNSGDTCGILGCKNNQSLEIIKLLIMKPNNNQPLNDVTMTQNNKSLRFACMYNKNLDVVKYLVQTIGANPLDLDDNEDNCLTAGCWTNDSLEIIKYLINDLKMDINHKDKIKDNCFVAACMNVVPSLCIIKYLITETDVDVNCINKRNKSGLHYLRDNLILDFLINNEKINIKLNGMDVPRVQHIFQNLNDYNKINHLIPCGISYYGKNVIQGIVKELNPFVLTESNKRILKINPFAEKSYDQCVELLDKLKQKVTIPPLSCKKKRQIIGKNVLNDFTQPPELLFTHNNEKYYGHREIVYQTMYHFKNMKEKERSNKNHILDGSSSPLPRDIVVIYIKSLYTGSIDFEPVPEQHFIPFLKFIEHYSSSNCSIDQLEKNIVKYIDMRKEIEYCEYLKYICNKYQLKSMYLSMHNRKY